MLLKTIPVGIVYNLINDLKKDDIFVELTKNKNIKGFKWDCNGFAVLKQIKFILYATYDTKTNKQTYSIRYDLFNSENLESESLSELYRIAQEKLKSSGYKVYVEQHKNEIAKELYKVINSVSAEAQANTAVLVH